MIIEKGFNGYKNPNNQISKLINRYESKYKMKCKKILFYKYYSENQKEELTYAKFIETYSRDSTYKLKFELEKEPFLDHDWCEFISNTLNQTK